MPRLIPALIFFLSGWPLQAAPAFDAVALGVRGGVDDGNLSAWLLKPVAADNYVSLDSGTLVNGLTKAFGRNAPDILAHHIPAYLISHAHLDHYIGLVLAQPELRQQQTVMASQETMKTLLSYIFTWATWGNFGDEGEAPRLGFQRYHRLPLLTWETIPGTDMEVKAFPLSHGKGYPSTAFLIRHDQNFAIYFGDTGADVLEKSSNLSAIWAELAPLVRQKKLRAVFLECSFQESRANGELFGHLKPSLFMDELRQLAVRVDEKQPEQALAGLLVFVTHVKPALGSKGGDGTARAVLSELQAKNTLGLRLVLPVQGEHYQL
ncbi:MBL fold metallo-hydrolase [Legionella sp. CNM-4043-24]|uniref:MBL fold metallo-hydrolase n=1 Tax=Legionella sp. CNM-4043-24 TaxID=3421646 RepID=UPI00403AE853